MKQNQNGFAAMIAVLVVAAALVAGAGVYFYQTQVDQSKPAPAVQKIKNPPVVGKKEVETKKESGVIIVKDKGQSDSNIEYEMIKNERGFEFPEITDFKDENVKNKINRRIKEATSDFCECLSEDCQVKIEVVHDLNYIFSINVSAIWYCKGYLHDARVFEGLVFDMKTGNQIKLEDIFDMRDDRGILKLNNEVIALLAKYAQDINWENNDMCKDEYKEEFLRQYFYSYYISGNNIIFIPNMASASWGCTNDIVVPIKEILPMARAGGILSGLVN